MTAAVAPGLGAVTSTTPFITPVARPALSPLVQNLPLRGAHVSSQKQNSPCCFNRDTQNCHFHECRTASWHTATCTQVFLSLTVGVGAHRQVPRDAVPTHSAPFISLGKLKSRLRQAAATIWGV